MEALWSNNPAVAKLAQDYFELKWQSTTTLDTTRKTSKLGHGNSRLKSNGKIVSELH
jgi:hypothetical protein